MARKTVRRESSVGLIVTLIFFILTSVGLGVATYYGFAQQDQLTKDKKTAEDAAKDAQAKANWYQFQRCSPAPGSARRTAWTSTPTPTTTSPRRTTTC